jgi:hypothetical protein
MSNLNNGTLEKIIFIDDEILEMLCLPETARIHIKFIRSNLVSGSTTNSTPVSK